MPYMYILKCCDGSFYTGSAKNLEKRLWQHQNGLGAKHTKKRLPVKLVYCEEYERVDDAFYREKQVQGWSRAKKKALIDGRFDDIHELAECKNDTHSGNRGFDSVQPPGQRDQPLGHGDQMLESNNISERIRRERSRKNQD